MGIVKSKKFVRNNVFWPNINNDLENLVNNCMICNKYRNNNQKEPLMPHEISKFPWEKIGIDLFELDGKIYLVVVDYFSRYFELASLNHNSKCDQIILHLKNIFFTSRDSIVPNE